MLCAQAADLYEARAQALLGSARRASKLAVGTDAVREALREETLAVLVVADDAAGRREELTEIAERMSRRCVVLGTKASLGAALGRDEVGVAAILDMGIGVALVDAVARAEALREVE
jgi:ribosomal protein L7Ae-like RNA K-turn-binding protein